MADKRCGKCGNAYSGFGDTCSACRKKLRSQGSALCCTKCGSHFWGFGGVCADCDTFLLDGWLRFEHDGNLIPGFCRLYHDRLDVWGGSEEADRNEPPTGSLILGDVISWRVHIDEDEQGFKQGGFLLHYGAYKKKAFVEHYEAYRAWSSALFSVLTCPFSAPAEPPKRQAGGEAPRGAAAVDPQGLQLAGFCGAERVSKAKLSHQKSTVNSRVKPFRVEDNVATDVALARLDLKASVLLQSASSLPAVVAVVAKVRSRLKVAAYSTAAPYRTGAQRGKPDLARLFKLQDKDHTGQMSWDEFLEMCRGLLQIPALEATDAQLRAVYQSLDVDKSGEVALEELIVFVEDPVRRMRQRLSRAARDGSSWKAFVAKYDSDNSGLIEWTEFVTMCRESLCILEDDAQLGLVFNALDLDGSGQVSTAELIDFLGVEGDPEEEVQQQGREGEGSVTLFDRHASLVYEGWLRFEHHGSLIKGYCHLYTDRLDAFETKNDADSGQAPQGSIPLADVLAWRIHTEVASGAPGNQTFGSFTLHCGSYQKKIHIAKAQDTEPWLAALRSVLMSPMSAASSFKPAGTPLLDVRHPPTTKPHEPRGSSSHHMQATKASSANRRDDTHLASLKNMLRNPYPVVQEDVVKLSADATAATQCAKTRKDLVHLVTQIRLRLKDAAWTAGGADWSLVFRQQDKDRSGKLCWDEFRSMCRRVLKIKDDKVSDVQLRAVYLTLDVDNSGEVSLEELIAFVADPLRRMRVRLQGAAQSSGDWEKFFQDQDQDGSGMMDFKEFQAMCRKQLSLLDDSSQLGLVFEALDADGSGQISVQEFITFINREVDPMAWSPPTAPGSAHRVTMAWNATR